MTVDIRVTWKVFFTYLVYCAHTDSVQVVMTADKAVLGQSGSIHCWANFQTDEVNPELEIRGSPSDLVFVWSVADNGSWSDSVSDSTRHRLDVDTSADNTVHLTLNIDDLDCQDEASYTCTATAAVANTTIVVQGSQRVELRVQVALIAPTLVVLSPQTMIVKENDWVDVECRAVVGHTNGTRLTWQLDRGNHAELVPNRDARIILQEAHNMSGDRDCQRQVTSRIRLVLTRKDHGSQVTCFVWDPDLQWPLPRRCQHEEQDLCARTTKLQVHYGVREESMQLYLVPESDVKDGAAVTLVCHADGYPPANYSWARPSPRTLTRDMAVLTPDSNISRLVLSRDVAVLTPDTSQFVLSSFDSKTDSGVYKCTAWNWVMGVELFSASQEIFLSPNSVVQKHVQLQDVPPLNKLNPTELILLGVAISTIAVFLVTLVVVVVAYASQRHRRGQFQPSSGAQKSALHKQTDDTDNSGASTESVTVSGSLQEGNITSSSGRLETPVTATLESETQSQKY